MNGLTSGATAPDTPSATSFAWWASASALSDRRVASSARVLGFIGKLISGFSGCLRGLEIRVNDRACARQHGAFDDIVRLRQLRRFLLLVPERRQERQQVARIQRG